MRSFLLMVVLCWFNGLDFLSGQSPEFTVTPVSNSRLFDAGWDLEYGPDDHLWVTERETGQVIRINPTTAARDVVLTIPGVFTDGRQDGLLGMALHPELLGEVPYVYLSYTYQNGGERRQRIARYTYSVSSDGTNGTLSDPMVLIENLPASNDHNSGRLLFGPDNKLYYTIGDQGGNQGANYCRPILSQILPTQEEIDQLDWRHYPGKTLRLELDGGVPDDNPVLKGVQSHVFTYGHRNAQGIVFGPGGQLYSSEHGPDTDDEVNLLAAGGNYGWPRVVGFRDDQAYDYCNWSSLNNCDAVEYDKFNCPSGATFQEESTLTDTNYTEPLFSMFAVGDDYDYNNPACSDSWVCRPNVAPSSIEYYGSDAIPEWKNSLLIVSLKRGRIYRVQLSADGNTIVGDTTRHFYTRNRLRDLVAAPNGTDFYALTDVGARVTTFDGLSSFRDFDNPSTLLKFSLAEPSSASEAEESVAFRVWPNPVEKILHIQSLKESGKTTTAMLYDAVGRRVRRVAFERVNATMDTTGLAAGIYWLRVESGGRFGVRRVVVL